MPGLDTLFDPAALILAKVDAELTAALAGKTLREARDLIDQIFLAKGLQAGMDRGIVVSYSLPSGRTLTTNFDQLQKAADFIQKQIAKLCRSGGIVCLPIEWSGE